MARCRAIEAARKHFFGNSHDGRERRHIVGFGTAAQTRADPPPNAADQRRPPKRRASRSEPGQCPARSLRRTGFTQTASGGLGRAAAGWPSAFLHGDAGLFAAVGEGVHRGGGDGAAGAADEGVDLG